jgi:hypothetical protein
MNPFSASLHKRRPGSVWFLVAMIFGVGAALNTFDHELRGEF